MDSTTTSSLVKLVSPSSKGAKSGTFWLWVRSQATAESFPIFSNFLDVAVARRVAFVPLLPRSTSFPLPYAVASLPPVRLRWVTPLLLLTFLLCVAFALCEPPSAYFHSPPSFIQCPEAPLRLACSPPFSSFFASPSY